MVFTTIHPDNYSDNQRKITSITTIERLFESCILGGNMLIQMSEPLIEDTTNHPHPSLCQFTSDSWVFSVYRLIKWLEAYRRAYGLPKNSSVRALTLQLKKVRELRDYLMHDEEYVVSGEGKKPKRYLSISEEEFSILSPSSTVTMHNSSINGKPIEQALHLGNKIEFYSFHKNICYTYTTAKKENFFDIEKLVEIEKELHDQD